VHISAPWHGASNRCPGTGGPTTSDHRPSLLSPSHTAHQSLQSYTASRADLVLPTQHQVWLKACIQCPPASPSCGRTLACRQQPMVLAAALLPRGCMVCSTRSHKARLRKCRRLPGQMALCSHPLRWGIELAGVCIARFLHPPLMRMCIRSMAVYVCILKSVRTSPLEMPPVCQISACSSTRVMTMQS